MKGDSMWPMKKKPDGDDEAKRLAKEIEDLKKKNKELQNQLYGSAQKKVCADPKLVEAAYDICKDLGFVPKDHSQEAVDAAIDELMRMCRTEKGMDKIIDGLERDRKTPETAFPSFDKFKESVEKQFPGASLTHLDLSEIIKELDAGRGPLKIGIMGVRSKDKEPTKLGFVTVYTKFEAQMLQKALAGAKNEEETMKAIQEFEAIQATAREMMLEDGINSDPGDEDGESEDEDGEERQEDTAPVPALQETPPVNAEKCKVVLVPVNLLEQYMASEAAAKNRHTREQTQSMIDIILGKKEPAPGCDGLRLKYLMTCIGARRRDALLDLFAKNPRLTHVAIINENNERLCTIKAR